MNAIFNKHLRDKILSVLRQNHGTFEKLQCVKDVYDCLLLDENKCWYTAPQYENLKKIIITKSENTILQLQDNFLALENKSDQKRDEEKEKKLKMLAESLESVINQCIDLVCCSVSVWDAGQNRHRHCRNKKIASENMCRFHRNRYKQALQRFWASEQDYLYLDLQNLVFQYL